MRLPLQRLVQLPTQFRDAPCELLLRLPPLARDQVEAAYPQDGGEQGGGDIAGGALSAYIVFAAARLGAPSSVILRMGGNIVVDTLIGAVPLLGDLLDASWKANRRNVALLQSYMEQPGPARRSSRLVLAGVLVVIAATAIGIAALTLLAVRWLAGLL